MDRTTFAGLTELVPGDALETDGGSFLGFNIATLDHFARLGAVTHHHDAHVGLANPSVAPTMLASAVGGTIGNDVTLHVGYTVLDSYGGETAISPLASGVTPGSLSDPGAAPTVTADTSAGSLAVGTYYYAVTLLDGTGGETVVGDYGEASRDPGTASGQMIVSGLHAILTAAGASTWRLYRSFNGGGWAYLTTGASDTLIDDGSLCADPTIVPPDANGTGGTNSVVVTVPGLASGDTVNLYASVVGDFASPALVTNFPRVGAASAVTIRNLTFGTGSPPPVSLSKPGASKIDALSEIINLASAIVSLGFASGGGGGGGASASVFTVPTKAGYISGTGADQRVIVQDDWVNIEVNIYKTSGSPPVVNDVILSIPPDLAPAFPKGFEASIDDVGGRTAIAVMTEGSVLLAETPVGSGFAFSARWYIG